MMLGHQGAVAGSASSPPAGWQSTGAVWSDGTTGNRFTATSLDLSTPYSWEVWLRNQKEYADFGGQFLTWPVAIQRVTGTTGLLVGAYRDGVIANAYQTSNAQIQSVVPYQQWHHCIVSVTPGSRLDVYVDGVRAGFSTQATLTNAQPFKGFVDADDAKFYHGWARDLVVWRRALTYYEAFLRYNEAAFSDPALESYAASIERHYWSAGSPTVDAAGAADFTQIGTPSWDPTGAGTPPPIDPLARAITMPVASSATDNTGNVASGASLTVMASTKIGGSNSSLLTRGSGRVYSSAGAVGYALRMLPDETVQWSLKFSSNRRLRLVTAAPLVVGTWYHIAGEWDGAAKVGYIRVDGVRVATTTILNETTGADEHITISVPIRICYDGSASDGSGVMCDVGMVPALLTAGDYTALATGRPSDAALAALSTTPAFFARLGALGDSTFQGTTLQALYGPGLVVDGTLGNGGNSFVFDVPA